MGAGGNAPEPAGKTAERRIPFLRRIKTASDPSCIERCQKSDSVSDFWQPEKSKAVFFYTFPIYISYKISKHFSCVRKIQADTSRRSTDRRTRFRHRSARRQGHFPRQWIPERPWKIRCHRLLKNHSIHNHRW